MSGLAIRIETSKTLKPGYEFASYEFFITLYHSNMLILATAIAIWVECCYGNSWLDSYSVLVIFVAPSYPQKLHD